MAKPATIGELAKAADVPTSTVRYYERIGLLKPEGRTDGNYRVYGRDALERLQFIRAAQATGFTLEDVQALLRLRPGAAKPCQEVQQLIEERLQEVDQRVRDLRRVKRVLSSSLKLCRETEDPDECQVLDQLSKRSSSRKRRRKS